MQLAYDQFVTVRWTSAIHEEWISSLASNRPDIQTTQLETVRDTINNAVPDCLILNYESLISTLTLPDDDDRHVLASAIAGECAYIVTCNLKDFPQTELKKYGIKATSPDDSLIQLYNVDEVSFRRSVQTVRNPLQHPPKTAPDYLNILKKSGLCRLSAALAPWISDI